MNREKFLEHMGTACKYRNYNGFMDDTFKLGKINKKELRYHFTYFVHKYSDCDVFFKINGIEFLVFMFGTYRNGSLCEYNLNWDGKVELFLKKDLLIKRIIEISKLSINN